MSFIRLALFAVPLDASAEACRISHHTAWEWRHRLFAAVDGHQDRIALRGRVSVGATFVHDADLSHGVLVGENGLADESYKADVRNPEYLEAMELVNNLQSYLNLYVYFFRVKRDDGRWPKIARVVRHLLMAEARFRR